MGADLYIYEKYEQNKNKYESLFNAAVKTRDANTDASKTEALQAEVSKYYDLMYSVGYFRDSYNGTALLRYLDMGDDDPASNNSVAGWHDYLTKKREKLINFICEAIESGEPISASL